MYLYITNICMLIYSPSKCMNMELSSEKIEHKAKKKS